MRFMVHMEFVDPLDELTPSEHAALLEQVVIPGLDALARWERDRRIIAGGLSEGARCIAFVVDAESHEALHAMLEELPFYSLVRLRLSALDGFGEAQAGEPATAPS